MGSQKGRARKRKGRSMMQKAASMQNMGHSQDDKENSAIGASREAVALLTQKLQSAQSALSDTRRALATAQAGAAQSAEIMQTRLLKCQTEKRYDKRKLARAKVANSKLRATAQEHNKLLKQLPLLRRQLASREMAVANTIESARKTVDEVNSRSAAAAADARKLLEIEAAKSKKILTCLKESRRAISNLRRRLTGSSYVLARAIEKAKTRPMRYKLIHKGIYSIEARELARLLSHSGCGQKKIGLLIQKIGRAMGVTVKDRMSARTVQRAVLEGGIAADIQLGYEISKSKSFTISGDATTHRHTNYEAQHLAVRVPSYSSMDCETPGESRSPLEHQNRLLGVSSTVDHTSEAQLTNWLSRFQSICDTYNASPLAQRQADETLSLESFALKIKGVSGDHAADQIKTFGLINDWKTDLTYIILARKRLSGGPPGSSGPALELLLNTAMEKAILAVGGSDVWTGLPPVAQLELYMKHVNEEYAVIGSQVFETLPVADQRELRLCLRVGCAMHKELNSVKGGNTAMMAAWKIHNLTPPLLLANKDNAATLSDVSLHGTGKPLTAAELRAIDVSSRGGVKLTSLAGALFNHKDDKKGFHDKYIQYFERMVGPHIKYFPDTSNIRYQSHCAAAAQLITYRKHYLQFLESVRNRKHQQSFNHLEGNVYAGLNDIGTLTELAVLVLYAQAITHPYAKAARIRQNGLLLGPLHDKLLAHISMLIDYPEHVLDTDAPATSATLDGEEWECPQAIEAVHHLSAELPHLRLLFREFLKGAKTTWERFTQEFTEGGAISQTTSEEKDDAFMFSTNDDNEGMLGAHRVWKRSHPSGTNTTFNAIYKHTHNNTEEFMKACLNADDHQHLRKEARHLDASKHEAEKRRAHVEHDIKIAQQNADNLEVKRQKDADKRASVLSTELVLEKGKLDCLNRKQLEAQLEVYRMKGDSVITLKSKIKTKADVREELDAAIGRYHAGSTEE